ncbi:RecA-like DNA recombinase [Rhodobacter phage RcZahn]|nr:RecA-like DNA recombinase [Rhodobacter phage RcZahn]
MAVKVKSKTNETAEQVLARYKKNMGESVGDFGGLPVSSDRIPTGLFELDLSLGGGIPRGRVTTLFGPEDSAKTSIAFLLIANHQRMWPDQVCVYVAIEPFDGTWAKQCGVDVARLAVLYPAYAEEAVDMIADMLEAEDCGLVVLDSIAAMITTQEADKSAEGDNPGKTALAVGKLCRKTALALREAEKLGRFPTLVYINQIRSKIGMMYGNPETTPGGNGPLFQSQVRLRMQSKAVMDSKISDTLPVRREITFNLKKSKMPIVSATGKTEMAVFPHDNLRIGDSNDVNTVLQYLKDYGAVEQLKKGWEILGEQYPTQEAFKSRFTSDRKFSAEVKQAIITRVLNDLGYDKQMAEFNVDADGVVTET